MTSILPFTTCDDNELNLFIYNKTLLSDRHIINKFNHLFSKIRFLNSLCNEMHLNDNFETSVFDDADYNDSASKYYDANEINVNHKSLGIDVKLTCINMNFRSIAANFDVLVSFFNEFEHIFDIIVLTETWLQIHQRFYTIFTNMLCL